MSSRTLLVCEPPMYGREALGHSSTRATHQPEETTRVTPATTSCANRRGSEGRAATRYTRPTTGTIKKAWSILARKPVPIRNAARTIQPVRPLSIARSVA